MTNLVEISRRDWEWQSIVLFDFQNIHHSSWFQSSLALALLRCILTEGTVYYDGIPMRKINLDALKSSTIIPQTVSAMRNVLITDITSIISPTFKWCVFTKNSPI